MKLLRAEATDAFEYGTLGQPVDASFIDGQIKLMISDSTQTWSDFLYSKFTSVIMRHFVEYGCQTVVLAFDDKRHVPRAKAITQKKRRDGVQIIDFGETDVLPTMLPSEWKNAIMNPWFKHRVIELICLNVPRLVSPPRPGCKLIVDWETVCEYTYYETSDEMPDPVPLEQPTHIGEADLKFTRWMRALRCPMLVEATDGDYIPIALGLKAAGLDHPVAILKAWNADKGVEFVHVDKLHAWIHKQMRRAGMQGPAWWEVRLFITLLGLSGTDFTRNLPLVTPFKMWTALPLIVRTFDMESDTRIHAAQGKRIVELLYSEAFPKHIDPMSRRSVWSQVRWNLVQTLCSVLFMFKHYVQPTHTHTQAQASKLGARNKALIPTDARIMCTLRNVNFLLAYWLDFQPPEGGLEDYGFRTDAGGVLVWDD
jgi:hypothetical protein